MKPELLKTKALREFSRSKKSEKNNAFGQLQVGINTVYARPIADEIMSETAQLGFSELRARELLRGVACIMMEEEIVLPQGKKNKHERAILITQLMERFHFNEDKSITITVNDSIKPLNQFLEDHEFSEDELNMLIADSMVYGKVLEVVNDQIQKNKGIVIETDSPAQFRIKGPKISIVFGDINEKAESLRKHSDILIHHEDAQTTKFGIIREGIQFIANDTYRTKLQEAISEHEISAVPKFRINDWPKDAMMTNLRNQVGEIIAKYEIEHVYHGDPKDLKYQVLFRLTTLPINEIFLAGDKLESYLRDSGAYKNWRNILFLNPEYVGSFTVNNSIVEAVAEEQALIINERAQNSDLPLEKLLTPTGIFAQNGWVIQKRNGNVYAVQEEGATSNMGSVDLRFEEIDPELANKYHRDLHYIHTPRTDIAFGLYVDGDSDPFSVVALEKIDRTYKANTLLYQGYDPRKCYDLTRLYSKPGTPGNTSSSMFTLAFNYLKANYPETQAILSSFMPSYATGISMTSGGFDDPVLVKPLQHTFVARQISGKKVYEHVTSRRKNEYKGEYIYSRIPLLPTIELMTHLQSPRYTPLIGADRLMLELI